MEHLVKEGVAYARTLHGNEEAARRIDLDALLDSIVCDYTDAGQDVALHTARRSRSSRGRRRCAASSATSSTTR